MSNTKLVPTWTFQRSLPEPFDVYSGSSAVFKNISSRYCTQPQKKATLHAATLQAVFTYMDLENPPAGKTPEELGAIGSQSNNFTIAEYPSRTGQLHVVIYNRITGKFIAGKFEQPLDLETQSEAYQFTETGNSGSALYFALMPTFLGDEELRFTTNCLLLPITPLPSYTLKENMWKMDTRHTLSLGFPFRITPVVQEIGISLPDFISRQSKSNFS